jgi:hypothetical protein
MPVLVADGGGGGGELLAWRWSLLDPVPTQLVSDLARPQPRVLPPLAEDL